MRHPTILHALPSWPNAGAPLSLEHAGAVAFSRTVDPTTGEFHDAVILAQFGEVYLDSLGE